MKRKLGPMPVWAWLVAGGAVVLYLVYRSRSSSSTTNANSVDPSSPMGLTYAQEAQDQAAGIDPLTGQTYAQEQATQGAFGGSGGGVGSGGSGGTPSVDTTGLATGATSTDVLSAQLADISTQLAALPGQGGVTDPQAQAAPVQTFAGEVNDVTAGVSALQGLASLFGPAAPAAPATTTKQNGNLPKLTATGAKRAPSGPTKPTPPKGYSSVGLGNGAWEFVPIIRRTVTHTPPKPTAPPKPERKTVHVSGKKK